MRFRDPIVEDLWRVRDTMLKKYDDDLGKLCDALRAKDAQGDRTVVRLPPRKPVKVVC